MDLLPDMSTGRTNGKNYGGKSHHGGGNVRKDASKVDSQTTLQDILLKIS